MTSSLLSTAGLQVLGRLSAQRALLAFDFDGTLAPIVARPEDAAVPQPLAQRMRWLCQHHPVAIVTGRDADDVRDRLGFRPAAIVGNHGADLGGHSAAADTVLAELDRTLAAERGALQRLGIRVERKRHSVAFHVREAPDVKAAQQFVESLLRRDGADLHLFGGKLVINATVAGAPDKAEAVRRLMGRFGAATALFVGDDVNDEVVFDAAIPGVVGVHMAPAGPTAAHFVLPEVLSLVRVADELLGAASGG